MACEFSNFKRLKNREDSSDFDDFCRKTIAAAQTFFSKIFAPPKFFRVVDIVVVVVVVVVVVGVVVVEV